MDNDIEALLKQFLAVCDKCNPQIGDVLLASLALMLEAHANSGMPKETLLAMVGEGYDRMEALVVPSTLN